MNYLQLAMTTPHLNTLVLLDKYAIAKNDFASYFAEARSLNSVIVRCTELEYRFPQGGMLRFGVLSGLDDLNRFRGGRWANVRVDYISDHQLATLAVATLFKPVYNGSQDGV